MAAPMILVDAQPRRVADGVAVTCRYLGGGGELPFLYAGNHYRSGIRGLPSIVTSMDFDGTDLGGGSVPQAMEVRWAASDSVLLAEHAAYHWPDARITVRIGPEGTLPPVLTSGTVLSAAVDGGDLVLALSDPAADLRKPILTDRFLGTGGIEGPIEWKGRIKRRAWGRVFNLPGDCIDKANSIYCFGDPQRAWAEFVEVRDKGAKASAVVVLGWQGSVAATFAALQAAAAPQGGCVVCPSIACVKWWTQPAGALCADIRGEIGAGYVETAASIAERIAGVVSAVPFAAGTVTAANAARPIAAGWVAGDENGTAAAALDKLLSDVSLLWVLDADAIAIRRWEWSAPVASARSLDVSRRQTFKPVGRRKLGYRRNQNVMSRDSIAGIVFVSNIAFDDGEALHDRLAAMAAATEAVEQIASGKVATFFQPGPPSAAESEEGDLWFDTDDGNFMYRRLAGNGRISIGGTVVTFPGYGAIVYPAWAPAPDQRIATALAQVAQAIQQAQAAQDTADDAIGSITAMADDGVLSAIEKKQLVIDDSRLQGAWTILDAQAGQLGITTERTAAANARAAWLAVRNAIVPAWNDVERDSPIDRAPYVAALGTYATSLTTLQKAISAKAATTADWNGVVGAGKDQLLADAATAKSNATIALGQITIIQSDGYLAAGEKRDIKARVADIQAEYPGIVAKAAQQGVSSTVYQAAYAALIAYLATLSPAWDNTNLDTAIVPVTFNGKFSDYYYARTDVIAACADLTSANTPAVTGPTPLNFSADYLGALDAGQVPRDYPYKRLRGGTDVTSSTVWSILSSDGVTVSIGATDGVAHITAVSKDAATFTIRSDYAGVVRDLPVIVQRNRAAAPVNTGSTGNPGTSGSVLATASTNSTDYGFADSASFTCVAGTAGQVALSATLTLSLYASSGVTYSQFGIAKAQWRAVGGPPTDVTGSESTSDGPAVYDKFDGPTFSSLSISVTKTGLTPGTTYEFRLTFKKASGNSGQTLSFSGMFAGQGS